MNPGDKLKPVSFNLPVWEIELINEEAKKRDRSASWIVRKLIEFWYKGKQEEVVH